MITESNLIGDQLTLDLGVERARVHKKNQWLLKSNLDYKNKVMSFDPSFIDSVFFNSGALSAAGATATFQVAEQNISSLTDFLIQVTAASIPAGGNVVFKNRRQFRWNKLL